MWLLKAHPPGVDLVVDLLCSYRFVERCLGSNAQPVLRAGSSSGCCQESIALDAQRLVELSKGIDTPRTLASESDPKR